VLANEGDDIARELSCYAAGQSLQRPLVCVAADRLLGLSFGWDVPDLDEGLRRRRGTWVRSVSKRGIRTAIGNPFLAFFPSGAEGRSTISRVSSSRAGPPNWDIGVSSSAIPEAGDVPLFGALVFIRPATLLDLAFLDFFGALHSHIQQIPAR
jgi:hypothetical protein